MNMFLTNKTRLKIKDIVRRISVDEQVSLEERIYVEKLAKHNSTIWTWLKKANSLRRYETKLRWNKWTDTITWT